ncbi:MAG TPA: replication factor A, partial [Euryarchaeota archaeon]|nr:replication factor A [Euryarchaeota archaeon]
MISVSEQEIIDRLLEKGMTKEEIENEIKERIEEMNGLISRMGALKIIANDHNISLFKASESVRVRIKNLVGGLDDVTVYGRVTDIFPVKEFTRKKGGKGKVASMIITDETGTTRVVLWDNKTNILDKIKIGDVVKVVQARVR